jgi:hypothetical protein
MVEAEPTRVVYETLPPRKSIVQQPASVQYVYVDDNNDTVQRRVIRENAPRSEVVYVDGDQPVEYIDQIVYVDENGNELDGANGDGGTRIK